MAASYLKYLRDKGSKNIWEAWKLEETRLKATFINKENTIRKIRETEKIIGFQKYRSIDSIEALKQYLDSFKLSK